jgi:hypothetical protein
MTSSADRLWQLNNEYRKLITQVSKYLDLLEQLMLARHDANSNQVLEIVQYAREQIALLDDEHRRWRYDYYYEAAENKRMVQADMAVNEALIYFGLMSARHQQYWNDLYALLNDIPHPAPNMTHVANGDLWALLQFAVTEITTFVDNLNNSD